MVELRAAGSEAPPDVCEVWARGECLGVGQVSVQGSVARLGIAIDGTSGFGRQDLGDTVAALAAVAASQGATQLELAGFSTLVRHEARRLGFVGGLRQPLTALVDGIGAPGAAHEWTVSPDRQDRAADLAAALRAWGVTAAPVRTAGAVGRVVNRLALGVADTLEVAVAWAADRTVTIGVPDRADLMPEAVALAADTTGAVLRRFAAQAAAIRSIRFDRSARGLTTGRYGGVADRSSGAIHLNVDYVAADASVESTHRKASEAQRAAAANGVSIMQRVTWGALGASAGPTAPFTVVETTIAHELWHHIEAAFEARHYSASVELRRGLGEVLGVETLERAIKGNEANAPESWKRAVVQLAQEVSPYATTNATEATAEMFKLWWCRMHPVTPVVARFGELVDWLIPPA